MSEKQLTDESMLTELCGKGFCVLPVYLPEKKLRVLRHSIRRIHPPWLDLPPTKIPSLGQLPTENTFPSRRTKSPFQEPCFNDAIVNADTIILSQRWLGTEKICIRDRS